MKKTLLAYAQLLRLPNGFTVLADGLLGLGTTGALLSLPLNSTAALVAGLAIYYAGMVSNDLFDRHEDAITRRFRPLPSGRVSVRQALVLAIALFMLGTAGGVVATAGHLLPLLCLALLIVAVLLYNGVLKQTFLGPITMGSCRFFHLLFVFTIPNNDALTPGLHIAACIGVYIAGVTWFARTEEYDGPKWELRPAAFVILLGLAGLLALPWQERFAEPYRLFPYALFLYGLWITSSLVHAIHDPRPAKVQASVKRSILGLIALDALLLALTHDAWAMLLLLLYLPARQLGRWVYST